LNDTTLVSVHITLKSKTWEGSDVILFMTLISLYNVLIMNNGSSL